MECVELLSQQVLYSSFLVIAPLAGIVFKLLKGEGLLEFVLWGTHFIYHKFQRQTIKISAKYLLLYLCNDSAV